MPKDDFVYLGHMLNMARKADDIVWDVVATDLPPVMAALQRIVSPEEK